MKQWHVYIMAHSGSSLLEEQINDLTNQSVGVGGWTEYLGDAATLVLFANYRVIDVLNQENGRALAMFYDLLL